MSRSKLPTITGVRVLIAPATTVGSLTLQAGSGRSPAFALAASIAAAIAAAAFAFWGARRV